MPATQEAIAAALAEESPWSDGVKSLIRWQFELHSDFKTALWNAIKTADQENLLRLSYGFPEEVKAFIHWNSGDLGEQLRKSGLEI
ncbi:MAG TPA: hypothetical protein VNL17_14705 [Verrucomicrobiae bacterium]|nr:hypothetical protein [Verrucomicrobiae bacterium]